MTTLKTKEEKVQRRSQPRKRVAFSAPKTVATKAMYVGQCLRGFGRILTSGCASIARNASDSPLLRLPFEIRNKIWIEVLGERLIHLDCRPDIESDSDTDEESHPEMVRGGASFSIPSSCLRHKVCEHDCPEDEPDGKVLNAGDRDGCYWIWSHHLCTADFDLPETLHSIKCGNNETLQLSLLPVSRQMYVEVNRVLWTTNTFSFAHGTMFQDFLMRRNVHQKRMIRSLLDYC